jgi:uncharacterized membrane protein
MKNIIMDLVILSGLVLGLIQVVKITTGLSSRYIPIATLLLTFGLISIFLLVNGSSLNWELIQNGLIVSLSAMGLWSGTKAVAGK